MGLGKVENVKSKSDWSKGVSEGKSGTLQKMPKMIGIDHWHYAVSTEPVGYGTKIKNSKNY